MIIRPAVIHIHRVLLTTTTSSARRQSTTSTALVAGRTRRAASCILHSTTDGRRRTHNTNISAASRPSSSASRRNLSAQAATMTPSAPPAQQIASFPSLVIGPNRRLSPQGSFAEAQAAFLDPPAETVANLLDQLIDLKVGIVAHYYMDVELQGVLHSVKKRQMELLRQQQMNEERPSSTTSSSTNNIINERRIPEYPLVAIADSLKMGDDAVQMCSRINVRAILCLGVDFMSESVSAILGRNGYPHVPVYRATARRIGCSLAESAEGDNYKAWLYKSAAEAAGGISAGAGGVAGAESLPSSSAETTKRKSSLHVVYINTSLETKAASSAIMPTIACTSSNVLQTILQASAQIGPEELQICYGPDTYMGENLISLLDAVLSSWTDDRIRSDLHPDHDRSTLRALRNNIHVYPGGNCVVHHMFGRSVVETVSNEYADAYVTAHLEVPGEMFQIALRKSLTDEGVVGSTSNILNFIERKVEEAARRRTRNDGDDETTTTTTRLKFILGTEAGMVTSIVRSVQDILESNACRNVEAEIIFPVSSEAVMGVDEADDDGDDGSTTTLEVVPGVAGGEGCSTAGGCATCPFMKMNDLDAVQDILDMIGQSSSTGNTMVWQLSKHLPPNRLAGKLINGRDAIDVGTEPIVYMREFMKEKRLSDALVERVKQGRRNVV